MIKLTAIFVFALVFTTPCFGAPATVPNIRITSSDCADLPTCGAAKPEQYACISAIAQADPVKQGRLLQVSDRIIRGQDANLIEGLARLLSQCGSETSYYSLPLIYKAANTPPYVGREIELSGTLLVTASQGSAPAKTEIGNWIVDNSGERSNLNGQIVSGKAIITGYGRVKLVFVSGTGNVRLVAGEQIDDPAADFFWCKGKVVSGSIEYLSTLFPAKVSELGEIMKSYRGYLIRSKGAPADTQVLCDYRSGSGAASIFQTAHRKEWLSRTGHTLVDVEWRYLP